MTNEELIKRIRRLAEDIIDTIGALDPLVVEDAPPTAIDKFIEPTTASLEDVRHALTTLAGAHGAAAPKKLLAAYNVKKLSELNPIHFTAVFHAANAEATAND